ncbi:hypothetical protein LSCM4_01435 [Leishmania orientalis]|uniref:Uncharacterized protein n=1 Tax=Leishmania orientalis TaxID=2249476 RepID=A0A836G4S6_9TRYP|nr:hypothetical protein LSCM4_01435 [Leishmania orientalis]
MLKQTGSVMVYVTYAALTMSLMVCSILSPIQVRSAGERKLSVYGVALVYDLPQNTSPASSGRPSRWSSRITEISSSSPLLVEVVRVKTSLRDLPPSTLKNFMAAYLFFAALCLFSCVSLLISVMVDMLPTKRRRFVVVVTHVFMVLVPLAAVLCFAMAAVLGLQSRLYSTVAAGYYTDARSGDPSSRLHSGFFSSVAAAFLGLFVALLSPLLRKW